jgi:hypothetical protein
MTREDIELLREPSSVVRINKLRDIHHIIARLIVTGMSNNEIAAEVGYTPSRISILRTSPAMQELIAKYRADDNTEWRIKRDEYYDDIVRAGRKAWRQINDTLDEAEDTGERIPLRELRAIADSSGDRVGYHKRTANLNVNVDFASKLEAAISRSRAVRQIDIESAE